MMKSALIKDLYFEMDRLKQGILFFLETFVENFRKIQHDHFPSEHVS